MTQRRCGNYTAAPSVGRQNGVASATRLWSAELPVCEPVIRRRFRGSPRGLVPGHALRKSPTHRKVVAATSCCRRGRLLLPSTAFRSDHSWRLLNASANHKVNEGRCEASTSMDKHLRASTKLGKELLAATNMCFLPRRLGPVGQRDARDPRIQDKRRREPSRRHIIL